MRVLKDPASNGRHSRRRGEECWDLPARLARLLPDQAERQADRRDFGALGGVASLLAH